MKPRNRPSSPARSPTPRRDSPAAARPFGLKDWLFIVALVVAVFLAYQPAWQGGLLWDDDAHITHPELRSWYGLYRIWFDVGATQQYYPLSETAFWVQYKLWGEAMLGYHLANIGLHALAAVLVALVLRRLKIPGAYLAAAIFALHPVQVESVAWVTEQKNTLSGVFYLGAAMAYLRFDENRRRAWYLGALGMFVLSLLAKIVTVTLPAALLVIFWWQRGRLRWRRDVAPLLPFFAIGVVLGVFVTRLERTQVGAQGPDFALTVVQRCLLPGRVIWFYLGKLCWPVDLRFMYPRWEVNGGIGWQYLFPLGLVLLLGVLWGLRRRWRGPLAGLLFFAGTLFPVWGFLNVYWFVFSYVADHFPYLASLGIITLVSAGAALLMSRWRRWDRRGGYAACLVLLAVLANLTWRQSQMYADIETLYRTVIAENPHCWLAYNNLGNVLHDRGHVDEAIAMFRTAIEIKPGYVEAHNNLGFALAGRGQIDKAITEYRRALEIKPVCAAAHYNLGVALIARGQVDDAIAEYGKALDIEPNYSEAHNNLGLALYNRGEWDDAIAHYRKALKIAPGNAVAYSNLGNALAGRGQVDEAIVQFQKALEISPRTAEFHYNLAQALAKQGRLDEVIAAYGKALEIKPDHAEAHNNLGVAIVGCGGLDDAIMHFQTALKIRPDYTEARNNLGVAQSKLEEILKALAERRDLLRSRPDDIALLNDTAWVLATNPNASIRNGTEAIELAQRAVQLSDGREPAVVGTLAAAYAETGQFPKAVETAQQALALAARQNNATLADVLRSRVRLYQDNSPYRDMRPFGGAQSGHP